MKARFPSLFTGADVPVAFSSGEFRVRLPDLLKALLPIPDIYRRKKADIFKF